MREIARQHGTLNEGLFKLEFSANLEDRSLGHKLFPSQCDIDSDISTLTLLVRVLGSRILPDQGNLAMSVLCVL